MAPKKLFLTALLLLFSGSFLQAQEIVSIDSDDLKSTYNLGDIDTVECIIQNVTASDTLRNPVDILYSAQQESTEGLFVDSFAGGLLPGNIDTVQALFKATGQYLNVGQNQVDLFARGILSNTIRSDSTTKTITVNDTVTHPLSIDLNPDDSAQTNLEDTLTMGEVDTFPIGLKNDGNAPLDTTVSILYQGENSNQVGTIEDSIQLNLAAGDSVSRSGNFQANSAYLPGGPSGVAIWPSFTIPGSLAGDTVMHNIYIEDTTSARPNQYKADPDAANIYPNPTTEAIKIKAERDKSIEYVRISTLEGKTVNTYHRATNTIPFNHLEQGMYLLEIAFRDQTQLSKKIIKQP